MNNKIFNYFEIAARAAVSKDDRRWFLLGAVGIRDDGTLVKSFNGSTEYPKREVHAEFRLSRKLDYGATVYVARVRMDTTIAPDGTKILTPTFGMSRPCQPCMRALHAKRVKRIYYTISKNEFGIINL